MTEPMPAKITNGDWRSVPLISDEELLGAIGRGWTHPENANKVVDVPLATAIEREVRMLLDAALVESEAGRG